MPVGLGQFKVHILNQLKDNSQCICADGTSGSGTVCSAYHLAIPLRNVPLVAYKTAECLDEYWKDIAELGSRQGFDFDFH